MSELRFASTNQLKMKNSEDKLVEIQIDELEKGEKDSVDKVLHEEVDKDEKDSVEKVRLLEEVENGEKDPKDKVQKKKKKKSIPEDNPNAYATKKTAVAGMLDMTILTRNGSLLNQKVLENQRDSNNYNTFVIFLLGLAIILQVSQK